MEKIESLNKQELVDRLVQITQEFADAYLLGKPRTELDRLRECIEELQKEIMSRPTSDSG